MNAESGRGLALSHSNRVIEPELLDVLPATDERAQQSRRDLRRLNWIMGHGRFMARMMQEAAFDTLIDLGTGDGLFAREVVRKLNRPVHLVLVDKQRVPGAPADVLVSDVMGFIHSLEPQPKTAIMANLFLHHFSDQSLRDLLLEASRKVDWFFACEPRRSRLSLAATRLLPLIGCNAVTRHDAAVSIRAGFLDRELSALWPGSAFGVRWLDTAFNSESEGHAVTPGALEIQSGVKPPHSKSAPKADGWTLTERECGYASHCFMASR